MSDVARAEDKTLEVERASSLKAHGILTHSGTRIFDRKNRAAAKARCSKSFRTIPEGTLMRSLLFSTRTRNKSSSESKIELVRFYGHLSPEGSATQALCDVPEILSYQRTV